MESETDTHLCSICLDCIEPSQGQALSECCHNVFHLGCMIENYSRWKLTCPLCRGNIFEPWIMPIEEETDSDFADNSSSPLPTITINIEKATANYLLSCYVECNSHVLDDIPVSLDIIRKDNFLRIHKDLFVTGNPAHFNIDFIPNTDMFYIIFNYLNDIMVKFYNLATNQLQCENIICFNNIVTHINTVHVAYSERELSITVKDTLDPSAIITKRINCLSLREIAP